MPQQKHFTVENENLRVALISPSGFTVLYHGKKKMYEDLRNYLVEIPRCRSLLFYMGGAQTIRVKTAAGIQTEMSMGQRSGTNAWKPVSKRIINLLERPA